jgi:hypothetical protein
MTRSCIKIENVGSFILSPMILKLYRYSICYDHSQHSNNTTQNKTKQKPMGLSALRLALNPITGERPGNWNGQSASDKKWCRTLTGVDGVLSDVRNCSSRYPSDSTPPLDSRVQWMTDCKAMSVIQYKFHTLKFPLTPSLSQWFREQPVSHRHYLPCTKHRETRHIFSCVVIHKNKEHNQTWYKTNIPCL